MAGPTMPWTWACLACNATWSGSTPHACAEPKEHLRTFWTRRLQWSAALREVPEASVRAIVCRPIARQRLVELLGPSWGTG